MQTVDTSNVTGVLACWHPPSMPKKSPEMVTKETPVAYLNVSIYVLDDISPVTSLFGLNDELLDSQCFFEWPISDVGKGRRWGEGGVAGRS